MARRSDDLRCLETRKRNGMKWRRYRDSLGMRHETYELPAGVISYIGIAKIKWIIARIERGNAIRRKAYETRRFVAENPDWKSTAIAHHLGITEARVRKIRQELSKESK